MSDQKMQECFEFYYDLKWEQVNDFEQQAWKAAWLASRECLVIELPEQGPSFTVGGVTSFSLKNEGRNEAIKEIEVSIHAVGVQTK